MNLAFACIFLWVGASMLYLASRGIEAATPWGAFQTVLTKMREA
jgi:hypothetical protein